MDLYVNRRVYGYRIKRTRLAPGAVAVKRYKGGYKKACHRLRGDPLPFRRGKIALEKMLAKKQGTVTYEEFSSSYLLPVEGVSATTVVPGYIGAYIDTFIRGGMTCVWHMLLQLATPRAMAILDMHLAKALTRADAMGVFPTWSFWNASCVHAFNVHCGHVYETTLDLSCVWRAWAPFVHKFDIFTSGERKDCLDCPAILVGARHRQFKDCPENAFECMMLATIRSIKARRSSARDYNRFIQQVVSTCHYSIRIYRLSRCTMHFMWLCIPSLLCKTWCEVIDCVDQTCEKCMQCGCAMCNTGRDTTPTQQYINRLDRHRQNMLVDFSTYTTLPEPHCAKHT